MVAVALCAAPTVARATGLQKQRAAISRPAVQAQFVLPARSARAARSTVQPKAIAGQVQEVAQVAESAAFIFGVSGVMVAMTLIGLAFGFVLLRVESLAEEGKI